MSEREVLNEEPLNDEVSVAEELEKLSKDDPDGLVQAEAVVEAAKDPSSPLHKYFEWSDTEAAQKWRLHQARALIVRVGVRVVENRPKMVNVTVAKADGTTRRGYVATDRAAADSTMVEQVIAESRKHVVAHRNRLSAFDEAREIVALLDQAISLMK